MRLWIKLVLKPLWEPSILPFSSNPRRPRWREVPPNCLHLFFTQTTICLQNDDTRIIKMSQIVSLQELILFLSKMAFLVFCVGFFPRGSFCGLRWHYQFKGGRLIRRDHISLNWRKYHHRHHHHFLSGIPYLYENQKGAEKTSAPLSHLQFPWLLLSAASSYHHLPSFSQSTISAGQIASNEA